MTNSRLALGMCFVLLAACSAGNKAGGPTSAPSGAPSVASGIKFPLYGGSRVLQSRTYRTVVNTTDASYNGVLMQGNGTYDGNEVVVAAPGTFAQMQAWLSGVATHPPTGYSVLHGTDLDHARGQVSRYGLDFRTFERRDGGTPIGLLVVVMDPVRVTRALGPALTLISKYRSMPEVMRAPIDAQIKAQTGFSVTEATQPESPLGMALGSLDLFAHSNQRAILLLDARKE
ncbi:MAG: hypothetical protein NVS1B14_04810 [Vulcanimicrobiaceae bacterium]